MLLAIIGIGAILVRDRLFDSDQPVINELAQRATDTAGTGTRSPGNPLALANPTRAPSPTPTNTPVPTNTPAPTPTPVDTQAPRKVAEAWVGLWSTGDYKSMYDLLSADTQKKVSQQDFIQRYTDIAKEAGLTKISAKLTGEPDLQGQAPIHVTMESGLVGKIEQDNTISLVKSGNQWRVAWTPSLIFRNLGDTGCVNFEGQLPTRGRILDRNGKVLAADIVVSQVGIVPGQLTDENAELTQLGQVLKMSPDDIRARYKDAGPTWFVPIKNMPGDQSRDIINATQNMPGVEVRRSTSRQYPYGALAAHVTGYVSPATAQDIQDDNTGSIKAGDMVARDGVEYGANDLLSGKPGGTLAIVECETRAQREVIAQTDGTPAKDVYLTLDIDFQKQVDKALSDVKGPTRGSAVILDPRTGAILALVSHPSYDPNGFITGFDQKAQAELNDQTKQPLLNRVTEATYPTGSIFKVITMSAGMKDLGYTGDTQIDCPSSFTIGNQTWDDWVVENGLGAQGMLTLHNGLVRSCNTVFYQVGAALDKKNENALPNMALAYGLGKPTGIPDFPEAGGTVPTPKWKQKVIKDGWSTGDAVNLAIGQGYLLATPLQMANAYAAIANGGTLLRPYIVDKTKEPKSSGTVQVGKRTVIRKLPLTKAQIDELHSALRDQTSNTEGVGSSRIFGNYPWPISGKTGTAQTSVANDSKPHSWFAAYGPGDAGDTATITSMVMYEDIGEGVTYAAPATKEIFDAYLKSPLSKK
jgi:penicillin-binding protein 2